MSRQQKRASVTGVLVLLIVVLGALLWVVVSGPAPRAFARDQDPPAAVDPRSALLEAGLHPEPLAAVGLDQYAVAGVVQLALSFLETHGGSLAQLEADCADLSREAAELQRLVRSGKALTEEVSLLASVRQSCAQAQAQRAELLDDLFTAATANLSGGQRAALQSIRSQQHSVLPAHLLLAERSEQQAVTLRAGLAARRYAERKGISPDSEAVYPLVQAEAEQDAYAALQNLSTNLGSVTGAYNGAFGG